MDVTRQATKIDQVLNQDIRKDISMQSLKIQNTDTTELKTDR